MKGFKTNAMAGIIIVVLFASTLYMMTNVILPVRAGLEGRKICVDPGHGGTDDGASGFGLKEKDVNLDVALRLKNLLIADGATPILTRETDVYVSLQGRCDIANNNNAERFVSIHSNAFDGNAKGTETYCHPSGSANSFDMRNKVHPEIVAHLGTVDRGVKTADFYVLRNTNMPAILCELAFIDNADDNAKLASPANRQEAARAILHGLQTHFGQSPHDPTVGGVVIPVDEFGLLAPYIGLTSTLTVATVATAIYVKRVKRRKEKQ